MALRVRAAAAMSEHPLATHAVGECVGQLLEQGGYAPEVLLLALTEPYLGALEDIQAAVRRLLDPAVLIGASAESVLAGAREVEQLGALTLFAVWADDTGAALADVDDAGGRAELVRPVRLTSSIGPEGPRLVGGDTLRGAEGTLVLLAEPFSSPVEDLLVQLHEIAPSLVVVGGMASSARRPGGNRLALDAQIYTDGMVGALISPRISTTTIVSQGCRPIGSPMTVTRAERNVILELAGRPALERLMELIDSLTPQDRALAASGLHVGRVIDERRSEFGRGDFLIRNVLGADRDNGAVAVCDAVEVGSTVQFQVRDAQTADEDLLALMRGHSGAAGALVFTCNGRGTRLFPAPHHDAGVVSESLDAAAVGGMFCAGEIGPIGSTTFVHGLTASVLLFD